MATCVALGCTWTIAQEKREAKEKAKSDLPGKREAKKVHKGDSYQIHHHNPAAAARKPNGHPRPRSPIEIPNPE